MTNENKTIQILGHEDKPVTKNGSPHTIFQTSCGAMGCFEQDYINALKGLPTGQAIDVEVGYSTDGKYANIRKVQGVSKEANKPQIANPDVANAVAIAANRGPNRTSVKGTAYEKDPVGLAVEVFCAMTNRQNDIGIKTIPYEAIMFTSIALVKQAQEAFS